VSGVVAAYKVLIVSGLMVALVLVLFTFGLKLGGIP
jgi:hypothetical protein